MINVNGRPEIPELKETNVIEQQDMTLRDYFAGKAMGAIIANDNTRGISMPILAEKAYRTADAMIKERERSERRHG